MTTIALNEVQIKGKLEFTIPEEAPDAVVYAEQGWGPEWMAQRLWSAPGLTFGPLGHARGCRRRAHLLPPPRLAGIPLALASPSRPAQVAVTVPAKDVILLRYDG